MSEESQEPRAELTTFSCKDCVVYLPLPAASTVGHRAELWNVEKPLQDVSCSVVTSGDDCWVRLFDCKSGELFAECPVAKDKPLTTCVEPVVDSSRYFVLRVADKASGRHAFIGFGFRERGAASDFTAALSDYQGYLRRAREAVSMRQAFKAAESGEQGPHVPALDFALKPGETLSLNLSAKAPAARGSFLSERFAALSMAPEQQSTATPASSDAGGVAPLLPPPPTASVRRTLSGPLSEAPPSEVASSAARAHGGLGTSEAANSSAQAHDAVPAEAGTEQGAGKEEEKEGTEDAAGDGNEEEFGGFVGVT